MTDHIVVVSQEKSLDLGLIRIKKMEAELDPKGGNFG